MNESHGATSAAATCAAVGSPKAARTRARSLGRWGPLFVVAPLLVVASTWLLVAGGSEPVVVLRYLGVWVVLILVPGVLVWQWLAGRSSPEIEIGAGVVTGVALFLVSWIVATAAGQPLLTWLIVGAVIIACVIDRGRRRHRLRTARRARVDGRDSPWAWWVAIAVVALLAMARAGWLYIVNTPLPPAQLTLSPDIWYYLGIADQLMHGFPVADPSLAGGTIRYHWFGIAVTAAPAQLAGVDLVPALLHFWFVPFVVLWVAATSAATRVVLDLLSGGEAPSHGWIWGPLAALFTVVVPPAVVLSPFPVGSLANGLNNGSASGAFAGLYLVALTCVLPAVLSPRCRPGVVLLLALIIVASAGTKPTVLPICAAGCALVALVARLQGRSWKPPAVVVAVCLLAYAVASRVVVGSDAGVHVQPFGIVAADPGYRELYRPAGSPPPSSGGLVLPALADGRPGAAGLVLGYLGLFLLGQSVRLLGLVMLPFTRLVRQPVCWWLAGCIAAGYVLSLTISHVGVSQQWFAANVSSLGVVLTTAAAAVLLPARPTLRAGLAIAAAVVVGIGTGAAVLASTTSPGDLNQQWPGPVERLLPYAVLLAVAGAVVLLHRILIARAVAGVSDMATSVLVVAVLLGSSLPNTITWVWHRDPPPASSPWTLSRERQEAALWVRDHSDQGDVLLSNVFCLPVRYLEGCNHSGVWVSALSARRLLLDGWFYLPENLKQFDGSASAWRMPSPYPDRLTLSLDVVQQPDRAAVCSAFVDHHVRWVFADLDATLVSTRLEQYADVVYSNADVTVYRLHDLAAYCSGR